MLRLRNDWWVSSVEVTGGLDKNRLGECRAKI